jgi:hypothetical protein
MRPPVSRAAAGAITNWILVLAVAAVCFVLGFVLVNSIARRNATIAKPQLVETPKLEEVRPKAEAGEAEAQMKLGVVYAKGLGVAQDYKQAAQWYRKAAEQGHPAAQTALGELYEAGQGVARDAAEAANWYRRAAEQGDAGGQYNLAVLYVVGRGVAVDDAEAIKWYRKAAEQGDSLAQFNLGMRYYEAHGVAPDPIEAYKWLSLAAAQGIPDAAKARDNLKRTMTREQLAEARRRTDAFSAKKPAAR